MRYHLTSALIGFVVPHPPKTSKVLGEVHLDSCIISLGSLKPLLAE